MSATLAPEGHGGDVPPWGKPAHIRRKFLRVVCQKPACKKHWWKRP
jgi:hypothetical protein